MNLDGRPLILAPSSGDGWFGGKAVCASDPTCVLDSCSPASAIELVQAAFDSAVPMLAVALLPYEGDSSAYVYPHYEVSAAPPDADGFQGARANLMIDPVGEMDESSFTAAVLAAQQSILAGDVYVLNLTYRLRGRAALSPELAFAQMHNTHPAPMAAFLGRPETSIASVSPERFLSAYRDEAGAIMVATQPIKGTAPRGSTPDMDNELAASLRASEKERAEHVMIVDMERNDLGRVCRAGSVKVEPMFEVIQTPYCHQMVSSVRGILHPGTAVFDVIQATFPTGSVTGAPKLSAMNRIAQLELSSRGAYTGALVVAMPGQMDSSVLIRTLEYSGPRVSWGTGCGITIDSDPTAEWRESVLKCAPLLGDAMTPTSPANS